MLSLLSVAEFADRFRADWDLPVAPLVIGDRSIDTDGSPAIMGTVNLSRDSTYRESVAFSTESAIRKARVIAALGADVVDIGAESSTAAAHRVDAAAQVAALVPVIEQVASEGIAVSVETYEPEVVRACLAAGACVLNMTGTEHEDRMLELVAEHDATVILCYSGGGNVREVTEVRSTGDPIPGLIDHFAPRAERARANGVERIVIDPGMGFYYGNLVDPSARVRHQSRVLLNGFRLRSLGLPLCNALPHAFDVFEDQFRTAEGFYAVLARLGGTGLLRTHEVAQVRSVLAAMGGIEPD